MRQHWVVCLIFLSMSLGISGGAEGENVAFDRNSLKVDFLEVTEENRNLFANATMRNRLLGEEWGKISVEFSTEQEMTDSVKFDFFVAGNDRLAEKDSENEDKGDLRDEGAIPVVLIGSLTMVNIPKGREHEVTFYIHPSTVERFFGKRRKRDLQERRVPVRVEAREGNGKVKVIEGGVEKGEDWMSGRKRVEKMLIPVNESPWWPWQVRMYNQIL